MAETNPGRFSPPSADEVLDKLIGDFAYRLRENAQEIARRRGILQVSGENVREAYDRLVKSRLARAKAVTVAQGQFRYNRFWEWATFVMACCLFVLGVCALLYGFFGSPEIGARITTIAGGSFLQLLVFVPLRMTVVTRRHNFAIAIFAHLLDRVDDPAAVASLCGKLLDEMAAKQSAP